MLTCIDLMPLSTISTYPRLASNLNGNWLISICIYCWCLPFLVVSVLEHKIPEDSFHVFNSLQKALGPHCAQELNRSLFLGVQPPYLWLCPSLSARL